jgi:PAS domain S-box-containing protein
MRPHSDNLLRTDDSILLNQFFNGLLETSESIVIRAVDRKYCFLFYNTPYKKALKRMYEIDAVIGMNLLDCISFADDRSKIKSMFDRTFAGESFTSMVCYGEQDKFFYENSCHPIRDEKGTVIGAIAIGIDVTGRKRTEEALQKNENNFKSLFMSLSDGFYLSQILYDDRGDPADYRYLEVNPTFEQVLGLRRDQIVGKRYRELVPVDTTQWLDNYCRVARTGEPATYEFYSAEYKKYFETYAYKTAIDQISVFVRDVTDRKNTEQALQNMQKLESLGILAGGIAHDFNNMLGGLFGCIDLAADALSSGKIPLAQTKLSDAMQSLDILKSLANQLLTFARGGAPYLGKIAIKPLLENSCMLAISGSSMRCRFDLAPDLMWCECDKNQIAQVITNIVINAKQAMHEGGEVVIAARNAILRPQEKVGLPQGGKYVLISVKDCGAGIPPEIVKNIFDPFFTTKASGHGLGLATAYSIIKRHHGLIEVESELGTGSLFQIYLPAAPAEQETAVETKPVHYTGHGPILIMDDDEGIRSVYREMIQLTGHSCAEAKNGEDAIRLFKEALDNHRPFVITFLDLTVRGGKGGLETLAELRMLQPDAKVVVSSGYSNDPNMSEPAMVGFCDRLPKPFTYEDFMGVLLRVRKNASSQSAP